MDTDTHTVSVLRPAAQAFPLVLDSPHSGREYPVDFRPSLPLSLLRRGEDRFVDLLFDAAPSHGATLVKARFARSYVDPNRHPDDIDPAMLVGPWPGPLRPSRAGELGVGLIWRLLDPETPIYDRQLTVDEVRHRVDRYWHPYHRLLQAELDHAHRRHGAVWHLNCHSMLSLGSPLSPDPGRRRPDFVLGDLDGKSCEPGFTEVVRDTLQALGYSVALNDPFKGAELVRRHGKPLHGRNSLQVEINRGLYLDDATLEPSPGFDALRADLDRLIAALADYVRAAVSRPAPAD
jgi:N-formylglutamate deformylase